MKNAPATAKQRLALAKQRAVLAGLETPIASSTSESPARSALLASEQELAGLLEQLSGRKTSKKRRFIVALAQYGVVSPAAIEAGLSWAAIDRYREEDEAFRLAWDKAAEVSMDTLEYAYKQRALHGVKRPVVSAGKVVRDDDGNVIYVTEYSDRGAEFILKGRRAVIYRERMQHTGDPSQPIFIRTDKGDSAL